MADRRVQAAVDDLAASLGLPVLVEDGRHWPLWWSAHDLVDGTRTRTILHRALAAAESGIVKKMRLSKATGPVRTPAIPETDMWSRWCVPVRSGTTFLGFLWIIDRDEMLTEADWPKMTACAEVAAAEMMRSRQESDDMDRQVAMLVGQLVKGPDPMAADRLIELQRLPATATVVVCDPGMPGGWAIPGDMTAHVVPPVDHPASGAPVPLAHLHAAIERARVTRRVVRAGARVSRASWSALGAWHMVAATPFELAVADVHPGADILARRAKNDLVVTARTVLELGGDMPRAAAELHVHRTTLYYRLDRIQALVGVDLRSGEDRTDLLLALRLAAYRSTTAD